MSVPIPGAQQAIDAWVKAAQVVQGFSTPFIAILVGVITFLVQRRQTRTQEHQAETQRRQYRLALMDRRMKVFNATQEFIALILGGARIERLETLFTFARNTQEHYLLFGAEVGDYLDELYKKGAELYEIYQLSQPDNIIRPADIQRQFRIAAWFSEQPSAARDKFLKYMDFREP